MAVTVFKEIAKAAAIHKDEGVNGLLTYIQTYPGKRASDLAAALDTQLRSIEIRLKQFKCTS